VCILSTSAASQRPVQRTVSSQVTIHLRTDRVWPSAGQELDSNPGRTDLQSGALPLSHLSSTSVYTYMIHSSNLIFFLGLGSYV
jgi:hypothetical protein